MSETQMVDGAAAAQPDPGAMMEGDILAAQPAGKEGVAGAPVDPSHWASSLPESLRTPKVLGFDSVEKLVESYNNAQSLLGRKGLEPLPPDAGPEEREEFFKRVGRPDSPEGYKVEAEASEELKLVADSMRADAFEAGLRPDQYSRMVEGLARMEADALARQEEEAAAERAEHLEVLRREWGDAFEANAAAARKVADSLGIRQLLSDAGLGMNPKVLGALLQVGKRMSEGGLVPGSSGIGPRERLQQVEADPALMNPADPRHRSLVAERMNLVAQVAGL